MSAPVEQDLEVIARQCFPTEKMKAIKHYRQEPWVDDAINRAPSDEGLYHAEFLVRQSDHLRVVADLKREIALLRTTGEVVAGAIPRMDQARKDLAETRAQLQQCRSLLLRSRHSLSRGSNLANEIRKFLCERPVKK